MAYGIKLKVWGERACFTRPELKVERLSYDVMTPSAARGVLEAIHWKPAIRWVVDAIHVLKPIKVQTFRRNEVGQKIPVSSVKSALKNGDVTHLYQEIEGDRQQRAATFLSDVAYVIEAHFELTGQSGANAEESEGKHLDIFNRRARRGQCFHRPYLGTRECPAHFALIDEDTSHPAIQDNRDLGLMLWDIDHAQGRMPLFFRARLDRGVMRVPPPGSKEVLR